jgi:hypothetical protein
MAGPAMACDVFAEGDHVTVRGQVTQEWMGESEGHAPRLYMNVRLDRAMCFELQPDNEITEIEGDPIGRRWLNRHVEIHGQMIAGDAWTLTVDSIRSAGRARAKPHGGLIYE